MPNNVTYYFAIIFSMMMVVQHASLQFSQPIEVDRQNRYKILNNLEINALASDDSLKVGRYIYIFVYMLIFFVALFFWENLSDLFSIANDRKKEGAKGMPSFLADVTGGNELARPFAVAATLMALLAVGGQLAKYEEPVRRFAHRRAGIPRGIYRVAKILNTLDYYAFNNKRQSRLLNKFNKKIRELQSAECECDPTVVEKIQKQLLKLDNLSHSVVGDQFDFTFNFAKVDKLDPRICELKESVKKNRVRY